MLLLGVIPMTAKLNFTKEQVMAAYSGDVSIAEAARTLGCSFVPLTKLMREYGIAAKPRWRTGRKRSKIQQLNDRAWMHEQLVEKGRSQRSVAIELGTTAGNVSHYARRHDLFPKREQSAASREWFRTRYPNGRTGPEAANWRGGRVQSGNGYIKIYMPQHPHAKKGYIAEHRYVMEQKLGRLLEPGEIVDHLDRNRSNNAPENLALHTTRAQHVKDHFSARDKMFALIKEIRHLCVGVESVPCSALIPLLDSAFQKVS